MPDPVLFQLQSHHFPYDGIAHLHRSHQNEHVEHQLAHVLPYHGRRCRICVNHRRGRCKLGEYDTGQNDDRSFQTHRRISLQEADPHILGGLPGKCGERNRRDGRIHIQLEEPAIDGENDDERQNCYDQTADQRHRPKRNAFEKTTVFNSFHHLFRQCRLSGSCDPGGPHNGTDDSLNNGEDRHHQLQPVGDNAFCNGKTDKEFQRMLRPFHFIQTGTGPCHSH